ncbi:DUF485 domain-containing protein [Streptomyces sp. enrichment culture]|uniref:DUF485 domain-containing protein n=1 Tax=Streptomyces sp. enrichment culture TaxID=1795815 RepID=UPI003F57CF85
MQQNNDRPRVAGGGQQSATDPADGPRQAAGDAGDVRYNDPWYDVLASGWGESAHPGGTAAPVPSARREVPADTGADVYLEVQRSAAFQEVRSRYRRFVIPGTAAFLLWYVAYVVTATGAPDLMARPVAGAVNVGMLAGLGQFLTTFLLTWAYTRHARLRRDRAALDLRWDTQELARGRSGAA